MDYRIWSQILLELALAVSGDQNLDRLLKKAIPAFLRKLDCTYVNVLQKDNHGELFTRYIAPKWTKNHKDYEPIVEYFTEQHAMGFSDPVVYVVEGSYYYGYLLPDFGLLILGRGNPISAELIKELVPIVNNLAQNLMGCLEVQKRKTAEEQLKQERSFLTALINTIPDLVFYKDTEGTYQLVNESAARLRSLSPEEFVGLRDEDIHQEHKASGYSRRDQQILTSGIPFSYETSYESPEGKEIPYETSLSPFYSEEGSIQGIIGIARDISHRKEIEAALDRKMRFQHLLMNLATEFINVSIDDIDESIRLALDSVGHFTSVERAYLLLQGEEESLTHYEWCLDPSRTLQTVFSVASPTGLVRHWMKYHDQGNILHIPEVKEGERQGILHAFLVKQGVQTLISIPLMSQGLCLGFVAFDSFTQKKRWAEDEIALLKVMAELFTSAILRRQHEKELVEARYSAENASRAKSSFLANMSHEIRTPLNGIVGMVYLLQDTPLRNDQHEYLGMIGDSVDSLLGIINNILDFSKIEAGFLELAEEPFNLEDEIYRVVGIVSGKSAKRKLELIVDYDPNAPKRFVGDYMRVRQVLLNLLGNAVKFTERGHVLVRTAWVDNRIRVEVEDTGVGIAEKSQGEIFNQFTQEDDSSTKKYGGTGLGLSIAKQLVELMQGEITVKSKVNVGSTFTFTLLLKPLEDEELPEFDARALVGAKALVIDDHPINRRILQSYLDSWEMTCEVAESGIGALQVLESSLRRGVTFDIALVDMAMPGMDGLTLGKTIRTRTDWDSMRMIMLSSIVGTLRPQEILASGYDRAIPKPFPKMDLYHAMCQVLSLGEYRLRMNQDKTAPAKAETTEDRVDNVRILLVDDHATNRKAAKLILGKRGYTVLEAENGFVALEKIMENPVDLVLMDIQMPGMDGYETTRKIRELGENYQKIPIIALTANAMLQDRERCLAAGMNGHIAKPFKLEELTQVYETYLRDGEDRGSVPQQLTMIQSKDFAVFDEEAFLKRYEGDLEIALEVLESYLGDLSMHVKSIFQAVDSTDPEAVQSSAHNLKGGSGYVSACQLEQLSRELMHAAEQKNWKHIAERVQRLPLAKEEFARQATLWLQSRKA